MSGIDVSICCRERPMCVAIATNQKTDINFYCCVIKLKNIEWANDKTKILNELYNGKDLTESKLRQILCLFKLESEEGFIKEMQNKPVYLALSMDKNSIVKLKPQNLLTNLPLIDYS